MEKHSKAFARPADHWCRHNVMSISIERGFLKRADAFAKRHKLKRSQRVAEGLQLVMQRQAG